MFYREVLPRGPLRDWVRCFWVLEHVPGPDPTPEKILPDGRTELIFNLGAPYRRVEADAATDQPSSFVVGQLRRYIEIVPAGPVSIIGVRLEPAALHRLLGAPVAELTDRSVSLRELGLVDLVELEERLRAADGWGARLQLLEEALLRRLFSDGEREGRAGAATRFIQETHGRVDLGQVARSVGVSARTLDRSFAAEVGLTPKLFSRQVRLQRVFELLSRAPRPSWAAISLASGCFDQAHLNREFRTLAGEPPAAFIQSQHELSDRLTGLRE